MSSKQHSNHWLNGGTQRIGTVGNVLDILSRHVVPFLVRLTALVAENCIVSLHVLSRQIPQVNIIFVTGKQIFVSYVFFHAEL